MKTPTQKMAPTTLPPDSRSLYRHGMMPKINHDQAARLNLLASLNAFVATTLSPGVRLAYERQVMPNLEATDLDLADPQVRTGITLREAMRCSPIYQAWASLRRNIQEMNRQNARHIAIEQMDALVDQAESLNTTKDTLRLEPKQVVPRYLAQADNHLQPGGYHTEIKPGEMTAAATYDIATFVTSMGSFGAKGDSGGRAVTAWLRRYFPDFKPKRILDLGSAHGNNTLPLASAFPEAEVIALDVGTPMLRYGHARAQSMGFTNVRFVQGTAEELNDSLGTFDWVQTTMVCHETSGPALRQMLKRIHSVLKPNGLTLHVEQPNFTSDTPVFDRFMSNWDAWYNNEPFWVQLHGMNMMKELEQAGFDPRKCFESGANPDIEPGTYPEWTSRISRHDHEHEHAKSQKKETGYNGEGWYLFGAWK